MFWPISRNDGVEALSLQTFPKAFMSHETIATSVSWLPSKRYILSVIFSKTSPNIQREMRGITFRS